MSERPTAPPPKDGPSEQAVRNVKLALLHLAETDPEVQGLLAGAPHHHPLKHALLELLTQDDEIRAAIAALIAPRDVQPAVLATIPEAEVAGHVVELIEEKMRQVLRPDAFRRPTFVR